MNLPKIKTYDHFLISYVFMNKQSIAASNHPLFRVSAAKMRMESPVTTRLQAK